MESAKGKIALASFESQVNAKSMWVVARDQLPQYIEQSRLPEQKQVFSITTLHNEYTERDGYRS